MLVVEGQVAPDGPRASYPIVAELTDAERFNKTIVLDSDITIEETGARVRRVLWGPLVCHITQFDFLLPSVVSKLRLGWMSAALTPT